MRFINPFTRRREQQRAAKEAESQARVLEIAGEAKKFFGGKLNKDGKAINAEDVMEYASEIVGYPVGKPESK